MKAWIIRQIGGGRHHKRDCSGATIYFDPLAAATISAFSTLQPPAVNSARISIESPSYVSYHRQTRTQIALLDKLYSLVAIDRTTSMLHWMVVDIPAQELASSVNGITNRDVQATLHIAATSIVLD
ncbi:hypothetical protein KIN20_009445 [Parelaphostrongylus tenuis]|uniref:Uncharacterized protein n=1 Tax=Parelaphostrongylus tenuis TaxID=148309 RepID=A0AAD5QND4_PARTN|nr:hypothetical protein KIN20_009445 [Parelaphostrongylus tenuis]